VREILQPGVERAPGARAARSLPVVRPSCRSASKPEQVDLWIVIVSLHVASGAALGALTRSRLAALALGPPLHLACDRVPHEDIADRRFEVRSGLFGLALLVLCGGPLDPATLGAASASAPDLEHIFRRLRPHGRKLFHGGRGWHRSGRFRAEVQLVLAGAIIGLLLKPTGTVRSTDMADAGGSSAARQ
jgi:hypothetical protein